MMEPDYVKVDKDSLDFLYAVYFGNHEDEFQASINRAYRDMNRTLRFNGLPQEERSNLKHQAQDIIRMQIKSLWSMAVVGQKRYDKWHKELSEQIISQYKKSGILFTYGQAQKWINMTMKYLYVFGKREMNQLIDVCHVPLDNYIFKVASSSLDIEKPKIPWSRWNDYANQYMFYQELLRERLDGQIPFKWEFRGWSDAARVSVNEKMLHESEKQSHKACKRGHQCGKYPGNPGADESDP